MSVYQRMADIIRGRIDGEVPKTVLVLGSGLGDFVDSMQVDTVIDYSELDAFPQPTVVGHAGRLVIGSSGGHPLICMQGRMHAYEGHPASELAISVRTFKALGCENLILTNAAGSLDPDMGPGGLMLIDDHINWAGVNPLVGPNEDDFGPRFPDMTHAYDVEFGKDLMSAAAAEDIHLFRGIYIMAMGPNFETPAEIRAFGALGANAVGMSTVPEVLVANHAGMRVAAISVISNLAAGLGDDLGAGKITHEETLEEGSKAAGNLSRLLQRFFTGLTS